MIPSRPSVRHGLEDKDDDNFLPQVPKRDPLTFQNAEVGDRAFVPHDPKRDQALKKSSACVLLPRHPPKTGHANLKMAPTGVDGDSIQQDHRGRQGVRKPSIDFLPQTPPNRYNPSLKKTLDDSAESILDTIPRVETDDYDIDIEERKAAAPTLAVAFSPHVEAVLDDDDTEPNMTKGSLATHPYASSVTRTSALGAAALPSTSVARSTETVSTSDSRSSQYDKEAPPCSGNRVGAVVVAGLLGSTTNESSTGDTRPQSTVEEQPLQATLVAEPAISKEDAADIEAQVQARMHREAEDIADMVHRRIFQDTALAVVHTDEEPASSATKCEGDNWRKKKCILLVAVLVIAAAIGAGVGIPLSSSSSSSTEVFRDVLFNISGNSLDNETSPQFQALNWIAHEDPADTSVGISNIETIKQRYVAAVLYYALGGVNWFENYNFLTGLPVCSWNQDQTLGIICNSTNDRVEVLCLSKNGIRGSIPEEIGYFSNLSTIAMTEGAITGTLPSSLAELNLLEELNFSNCELVGTIPDFFYTHEQMTSVDLDNNSFTGTINPSLGNSTRLMNFWVYGNNLAGPIPASIGQSSVLMSVDLRYNAFTGTIPQFSADSEMRDFALEVNSLTGTIPTTIGQLSYLSLLFIGRNPLNGTIPTELGLLHNLEWLSLNTNSLIGTIPTELGLLSNLIYLGLASNKLTGTVPTNLANLTSLNDIYLFDNDLTGSLEAICGIDFEYFVASSCVEDEIECTCCTHCCEAGFVDCKEI